MTTQPTAPWRSKFSVFAALLLNFALSVGRVDFDDQFHFEIAFVVVIWTIFSAVDGRIFQYRSASVGLTSSR